MRIPDATEEDVRDMVSFCLRRLVARWSRLYDPNRSAWRTFVSVLMESAAKDARRWWRRQHRIACEELTSQIADGATAPAEGVEDVMEDALDGVDREVCRMRWEGAPEREIRRTLRLTRSEYKSSLDRIREALVARIRGTGAATPVPAGPVWPPPGPE